MSTVVVLTCALWAQAVAARPSVAGDDTGGGEWPYRRGEKQVNLYVSTTAGGRPSGDMYALHFGYGVQLRERWSLHVDGFAGAALKEDRPNESLSGVDSVLRWHYAGWAETVLHLDLVLGFQYAGGSFPDDSRHNFRSQAGFGLTRALGGRRRLVVGTRFMHVSNARTSRDNAGLNTAIVFAGLSWLR